MRPERRLWLIEYYRKNPETGERGWTIPFAWVNAPTRCHAKRRLAEADPLFDVTILASEQAEVVPLATKEPPLRLLEEGGA
jgi:hypothetical protein